MSGHTPGPWEVVDGGDFRQVHGPGGEAIAFEPIVVHRGSPATGTWVDANGEEANLRLIAAAPEMLEALRQAKDWLDEVGCDCGTDEPGTCAMCLVDAAIAKAEGK